MQGQNIRFRSLPKAAREDVLEVIVYSDYLCPWCWPAAVRLRQLREQFTGRIHITHKAFVLLGEDQERQFTSYYLQHREAANRITGLPYDLPPRGAHYPLSSLWALEAAKWVQARHPAAFDAYDLTLFEAFFQHTRDISSPDVLAELAEQQGLSGDELRAVLQRHPFREAVFADYREALEMGVTGIPTVVMHDYALSGAVAYEEYKSLARRLLSPQPAQD